MTLRDLWPGFQGRRDISEVEYRKTARLKDNCTRGKIP